MSNPLPFLAYVFVATFTPGPNNIMSMTIATRFGFRRTVPFNLGVLAGFSAVILGCSYFSLAMLNLLPRIRFAMELLGAGYMTFLAYKIATSAPHVSTNDSAKPLSFVSGTLLQLVNPKGILYGITVMGSFVLPNYRSSGALILFSLALAFVCFISTCCWALFGSFLQKAPPKLHRPFNVAMAVLLLYCAVSVFL